VTTPRTHAIVIGASIAGLVTARVLSEHVDEVTILERDRLPQEPATRRGVPQGRHAHVLLAKGRQLLDGWFPGIGDDLIDRGAVPIDAARMVWHQAGAHRTPADLGTISLCMTRPLLEDAVRGQLLQQRANVAIADGVSVERPLVEDERVVGVLVDGVERRADLVVDCSGRNTRLLAQLEDEGFPYPEVSAIGIEMAYGTRMVPRHDHHLDGDLVVSYGDPAGAHRLGTMLPVEGDQWMITCAAFHGDRPPTDPTEFEAITATLPSREIADVLADTVVPSPVLTHRMPTSQRRHVERLARMPAGFVVLGDAICSFNAVYGQGMSSAALQAEALGRSVQRHGVASPSLPRAFYRRSAKVVDVPWKLAATSDFADPRTTGPKPMGTDLTNRYLEKVLLACHTSPRVARQTVQVQNLMARPESLMTPTMIARVLLAARRSPARRASTETAAPAPVDRSGVLSRDEPVAA
jgi:2-polyprenyl-6-methoxyphenol hydroxylase-like FAD-dependent oxidoreductase